VAKQRDAKRETFWHRALRCRAPSGLTIVDFWAREGLKTTAYHYWHKEIKRRDADSPSQDADPVPGPSLLPVHHIDDRNCAAAVEIVAGNGLVIRVREEASSE